MPKIQRQCLVLTGPYTGKTVHLNGYQFEAGRLEMVGTLEDMEGLILYMGRSYNAYLEGSRELEAAQNFWADHNKETADGDRDVQAEEETPEEPGEPADGNVQPGERGSDAPPAVDGNPAAPPAEGTEGCVPSGDGHEDAGVPAEAKPEDEGRVVAPEVDPKLVAAVRMLNPENDDHWTQAGLPKLESVEVAYGSAGVTRAAVEAAVPGWDRDEALEAAVADLK